MSSHQLLVLELPYPGTSGNHHTRHGGGAHYLTRDAKAYRQDVAAAARKVHAAGLQLCGPLELRWVLAPPDERERDQVNVLKVAEDALVKAGVLIGDSNRVIRRTVVDWVPCVPQGKVLVEVVRMT